MTRQWLKILKRRNCYDTQKPWINLQSHFSNKLISHYDNSEKDVSVTYRDTAVSNHINVDNLKGNQEEADTKILLHAVDAVSRGAIQMDIYSVDTDVPVLWVSRYAMLCEALELIRMKMIFETNLLIPWSYESSSIS